MKRIQRKQSKHRQHLWMILCLVLTLTCSSIPAYAASIVRIGTGVKTVTANTSTTTSQYADAWQYWSQGASKYSVLRKSGDRVIAFAKLLQEAELLELDDPDAFFDWASTKGYFSSRSAIETASFGTAVLRYASTVGGRASLAAKVTLSGDQTTDAETIMKYINKGYHIVVSGSSHTAYIGLAASKAAKTPVIMDSRSNYSSSILTVVKYSTYTTNEFTVMRAYKCTKPAEETETPETNSNNNNNNNNNSSTNDTKETETESGHKHSYTIYTVEKYATCGEAGSAVYKCSCGEAGHSVTLPATGDHTRVAITGKAATCTEDGLSDGVKCSRCGTVLTEQRVIKAHGHTWNDGTVTKKATKSKAGTRVLTCITCGKTKKKTIPATNSLSVKEKKLLASKKDDVLSEAAIAPLLLQASKVENNAITIKWNKVKGAKRYVIYGGVCGKKYKLLKSVSAKKTSWTQKKLKKGTYYRYIVIAVNGSDSSALVKSVSKTIHVATTGGKAGNYKSVKLNNVTKKRISLKEGKSFTVNAKAVAGKKKVTSHHKLYFESSDTSVAVVSSKGKIKAVGEGTCYVYVSAQNGVYQKITVTVTEA